MGRKTSEESKTKLKTKMEIQKIEIEKLNSNEVQPEHRTKDVKQLKNNIAEYGLFYPVLVTRKNMQIVDGHRRVQAYKELGYKEIPCKFIDAQINESGITSVEAFGIVNKDVKKLTSKDYLAGFLKGGVVSANMLKKLVKLSGIYGEEFIQKLVDEKLGLESTSRLHDLAKKLGLDGKDTFPRFLDYLIRTKQYNLLRGLERQFSNEEIRKKIISAFMTDRLIQL